MKELKILSAIANADNHINCIDLINSLADHDHMELRQLITALKNSGLIEGDLLTSVSLTPAGYYHLDHLKDLEKQLADIHAREEREERAQNRVSNKQIIVSLAIFFLGVLIDHFDEIFSFLFH